MTSIIPTVMALSFFFSSRILKTGILQTAPNQFVKNQKPKTENQKPSKIIQDVSAWKMCRNVSSFFAETSLPKRPIRQQAI